MKYSKIINAIANYIEFVEVRSQQFNDRILTGSENTDAGFEEIICDYVDATGEIKKIRNRNKRLCLIYDALGYMERQTADILQISQQAVSKNIRYLKRFFSNK